MPYESKKQAKLMRAVAHGWEMPGGGGPSEAVAKKFVREDKKHPSGYAGGGNVDNKGYAGEVQMFAQGGPVLGRTRSFLKGPSEFRTSDNRVFKDGDVVQNNADPDQQLGKSGPAKGQGRYPAPPAHGKSLTPVKPRS